MINGWALRRLQLWPLVWLLGIFGCDRPGRPDPSRSSSEKPILVAAKAQGPAPLGPADYVGDETCGACHQKERALWLGSHHDRAMEVPTPASVEGDFSGTKFRHSGESFEFTSDKLGYNVKVTRPGEKPRTFPVRYTFGITPLQQYLVDVGGGRLQALSIAWDTRPKTAGGQRWFHTLGKAPIVPGDPLHWEGAQFTWNSRCADCHSTDVTRGYNPKDNTYNTTFRAIDVSCEACHGPGSNHASWATRQQSSPSHTDKDPGFERVFSKISERSWEWAEGAHIAHLTTRPPRHDEPGACAACHSRRSELGQSHGAKFDDAYRLSLLPEPLYYADGQMKDEVFVLGSFLQSKMHARGVVCSDCHEPHSLQLRKNGNELCASCHEAKHYNTEAHHFHQQGSQGALCTSCHMPKTTYMEVDPRSDHKFQVPHPALAQKVGAPDPCTRCHVQKTQTWAQSEIEKHHPARPITDEALALWLARSALPGARSALLRVVKNEQAPAIQRATALEELAAYPAPDLVALTRAAATSEDTLLRRTAASLTQLLPPADRARLLPPLARDKVRSVRIEAGEALLQIPPQALPSSVRADTDKALLELVAARTMTGDQCDARLDLAQWANRSGKPEEAEQWLRTAIEGDPSCSAAYLNLADLYRARGDDGEGLRILEKGLGYAADVPALHHSKGLTLIRLHERERALAELRAAHELAPDRAQFGFVYAVALFDMGEQASAIRVLQTLNKQRPGDRQILQTLVTYLQQTHKDEAAASYAERLGALIDSETP